MKGNEDIRRAFNAHFECLGVNMTEDCLRKERGGIDQNGWGIAYRWGKTADGAPYLDLYASHRRTNDRLYRIHADGHVETVATAQEYYVSNDEESKQEYYAHNRAFEEEKRRRGF